MDHLVRAASTLYYSVLFGDFVLLVSSVRWDSHPLPLNLLASCPAASPNMSALRPIKDSVDWTGTARLHPLAGGETAVSAWSAWSAPSCNLYQICQMSLRSAVVL